MATDLPADAVQWERRVNIQDEWDVRYWCERLAVTRDRLEAAVQAVGPRAADVARYLDTMP